ncbi:MAG TPA: thioredoxin [Ruminococcaceae bacterium]|nr:thioredoxin [Oscillospiraceae bacterium]
MKVTEVTTATFENEVLKSDKPVLVDFNADWCGPCQMLKPTIEQLAEERDDIKIVSVNIDENDDLAYDYDVSSIPCLVVFKDGKETKRSVGLKPKSEIIKLF